ncbi:NF-kappa-B-repressing factor [Linepithema humile]|uniref:NF-kappa-B-repressing factor n=1 Tax=Linepithema humile TaxID=83485 RepID=UPI0006230457|nr:PREDICTED: NF-kappa-B-repressing factor isoform X2 [Linepithema humile]XP_012227482.1 PREDICTED: NF-kappa-B-repressing factor isoform X2 [Linepithema humile]
MSTNEDVEQYKVEYESDEHWELRRKFLLAHKDKFSEDVLVCLAQVFVNIELLGCRYPQETMDLVKELSEDVAAEYREKQKKKLKRTFVQASEAASSKVKGCIARTSNVTEEHASNTSIPQTSKATDHIEPFSKEPDAKKLLSDAMKTSMSNTTSHKYQSYDQSDTEKIPSKRLKTEENVTVKNNPYGDIILWERPGDNPQVILHNSANIAGANIEWKYIQKQEIWKCTIYMNSKLASYADSNKKTAKIEAAIIALNELRRHCYTVKVKQKFDAKSNVTVTKDMKPQKSTSGDDWKSDSIGNKLMKMMGWTGGGLGKSEQGILEPMSAMVQSQISRKGLGLKGNSYTTREIKAKCQKLFKDFLKTDMQNDIVFLDFTNEERAMIHQIARTMGLKSRSYGSDNERKLIVSRKIDIRSLVKELTTIGGVTEKYELVKPTDEKFV